MEATQVQTPGIQGVHAATTSAGISEAAMEATLSGSLLSDYNEQLANIAQVMQTNLNAKKVIREELTQLQQINTREIEEVGGIKSVEVTEEEMNKLKNQYPGLSFTTQDGKHYVSKTGLESVIMGKQEEMAGLNTNSEMMAIQIQTLVDQRTQALTMLSNLIASRHEGAMSIIRNMKG